MSGRAIPRFKDGLSLINNSATNKNSDKLFILENRIIDALKAMEKDHRIEFTNSNGTNVDKWRAFQQKRKNLGSISEELKLDPRVTYIEYLSNKSIPLDMRLEAHKPTADQIATPDENRWSPPNEGTSRPGSPEHGGRRTRHKTRRGTGKRRHHTTKRRHR